MPYKKKKSRIKNEEKKRNVSDITVICDLIWYYLYDGCIIFFFYPINTTNLKYDE